MREFASRHCRPLPAGTPAMTDAEVATALRSFTGWVPDDGAISKTFTFPDYQRTLAFVNAVAWIAASEDHHPDMLVQYNRCRLAYSTHSVGGISENDFICAARIEGLFG